MPIFAWDAIAGWETCGDSYRPGVVDDGAAREVFSDRADAWTAWQSSPWGRLRYSIARETTQRAIADLPGQLRVIDVGGGDGTDSVPLMAQGHEVTVLDFAPELLSQAQRAAEAAGVADRLRTVRADLNDLVTDAAAAVSSLGTFDLVLCQNVLQYRADVPATVHLLAALLRPGGVLSLMAPNPAMDVLAAAVRRLDLPAALQVLDAPTVHGQTFDHPMRRLEAAEGERALAETGCVIEHRFGIRCLIDLIADEDIKTDPAFYTQLHDLELLLSEREPYWRTARLWQLTGRKPK